MEIVRQQAGTEPYGEDEHVPRRLCAFAEVQDFHAAMALQDEGAYLQYVPLFYPVGDYPNGDELVQIAAGIHRGELMLLDHELATGMDLLLTPEGRAELGYTATLQPTDADAFVGFCVANDYLVPLGNPPKTLAHVLEEYHDSIDKELGLCDKLFRGTEADMLAATGLDQFDFDIIPEVDIKKTGTFAKEGPDAYRHLEKGKKVTVGATDFFGIQFKYKVKRADGPEAAVATISTPSGKTVEQRFEVRSEDTPVVVYQGQRDGAVEEGEYVFRVRFPNNQYADEVKKKVKVKPS